jgi:hypothetical protein
MLGPVRPSRTQHSGKAYWASAVPRRGEGFKNRYDAWLAEVSARRIRMKSGMLSMAICSEGRGLRQKVEMQRLTPNITTSS